MNYACYASEQSAIENFWHNEKRLNSYRSFGCTALPGVYLISDWVLKSCPTIFKSIFPFEKKHNDFEARTEKEHFYDLSPPCDSRV